MKKVFVLGSQGMVGSRFVELLKDKFDFTSPTQEQLDLTDSNSLEKFIENKIPELIINFAAFTNVKAAQVEDGDKTGLVYKLNSLAVKNLADTAKKNNTRLLQISTEYVFDGTKSDSPYTEEDKPSPKNWYGKTKFFAEQFIQESGCKFLIVRISMPYRAKYDLKKDLVRSLVERLENRQPIQMITDANITPVFIDDLIFGLEALINKSIDGFYHIVPPDYTTPYEFINLIADEFNLDKSLINKTTFLDFTEGGDKLLNKNSWLSSGKFRKEFPDIDLHTIQQSIRLFKNQLY